MPAREEHDFFTVEERSLFRTRHFPEGATRAVVLFCHAFGEEKKNPHRVFVELARMLAESGVASVRFDLTGCGDSSGDLRDGTMDRWREDLAAVFDASADMAPPGSPRILLGLRLGASLAVGFAADRDDVSGLALWQPVVNGKRAFASDLRRTLIKQMMTDGASKTDRKELLARLEHGEGEIDFDGFPFTGRLYRSIAKVNLAEAKAGYRGPTLIVQLSHSSAPLPELGPLIERLDREDASATFKAIVSPPIWARIERVESEELQRATADWIESVIGGAP